MMASTLHPELVFLAAVVESGARIHLAAALRGAEAYFSSTYLVDHDTASPEAWPRRELPWWTVALAVHQEQVGAAPTICALSNEGEVELSTGEERLLERIPDAGLYAPTSMQHGWVTSIRRIGRHLHVCGGGGQVYRRVEPGRWEHLDTGLLQAPEDRNRLILSVIDGSTEDNLFVAGSLPGQSGYEGCLFHWNGVHWRRILLPEVGGINALHPESPARIWLVGLQGALLRGNPGMGFRRLLESRSPHTFHAVTLFQGTTYLGSDHGLFRWDEERRRVLRVRTELAIELSYVSFLEQRDGVLWAGGPEDLATFDGTAWTRHELPGPLARPPDR